MGSWTRRPSKPRRRVAGSCDRRWQPRAVPRRDRACSGVAHEVPSAPSVVQDCAGCATRPGSFVRTVRVGLAGVPLRAGVAGTDAGRSRATGNESGNVTPVALSQGRTPAGVGPRCSRPRRASTNRPTTCRHTLIHSLLSATTNQPPRLPRRHDASTRRWPGLGGASTGSVVRSSGGLFLTDLEEDHDQSDQNKGADSEDPKRNLIHAWHRTGGCKTCKWPRAERPATDDSLRRCPRPVRWARYSLARPSPDGGRPSTRTTCRPSAVLARSAVPP